MKGRGVPITLCNYPTGHASFSWFVFTLASSARCQEKAILIEQVIKACHNGMFCLIGSSVFMFWSVLFNAFRVGYRSEGKVLESEKIVLWAHSYANLYQVPPPDKRSVQKFKKLIEFPDMTAE